MRNKIYNRRLLNENYISNQDISIRRNSDYREVTVSISVYMKNGELLDTFNKIDNYVAAVISMFLVMFFDITDRRIVSKKNVSVITNQDILDKEIPEKRHAEYDKYLIDLTNTMRLAIVFNVGFDNAKGPGDMLMITKKFNNFQQYCLNYLICLVNGNVTFRKVDVYASNPNDGKDVVTFPIKYDITQDDSGHCERFEINQLLKNSYIFFGKDAAKYTYSSILKRISDGKLSTSDTNYLIGVKEKRHYVIEIDMDKISHITDVEVEMKALNTSDHALNISDELPGNWITLARIMESNKCDMYIYRHTITKLISGHYKRLTMYRATIVSRDIPLINDKQSFVFCNVSMPYKKQMLFPMDDLEQKIKPCTIEWHPDSKNNPGLQI